MCNIEKRQKISNNQKSFRMNTRVSYNGITSAFQADDRGSIPLTRS